MRPQDIVIGESYRHHDHPKYAWAKAVKILKPKEHPNTNTYTIVKCEYRIGREDTYGITKYFRPCDLVKDNN